MTYAEKLKDPRWQKMRLETLQSDNFTCQYCGETTKTLHIHHYAYSKSKDPWDVMPGDLITLCEDCHENRHKGILNATAQEIYDEIVTWAVVGGSAQNILRDINILINKKKNG